MVQSVERAFSILDAVSSRPAGVTAIAERVRLPKSTVARLLQTLEEVEAVERVDGPRWRIGPGVASLAGTASPERSLVAVARPHLARLVADVGEDAGLALPDGYDVHYVDQVESDNPVQVRDWTGTRAPMHAVPSGLVLLAEWPEEALAAYLAHGLERLTSHTVVGRDVPARAVSRRLATRGSPGVARSSRRGSARSPRRCATAAASRSPRCTCTGLRTASRRAVRSEGIARWWRRPRRLSAASCRSAPS